MPMMHWMHFASRRSFDAASLVTMDDGAGAEPASAMRQARGIPIGHTQVHASIVM